MQRPLDQLKLLAQSAIDHAREQLGLTLDLANPEPLETALAGAVSQLTGEEVEWLAACYGAWLGEACVRQFQGRWVGLNEPVAPRVEVRGVVFSPIDTIRRALFGPQSESLADSMDRIRSWAQRETLSREQVLELNQTAWDTQLLDARFSGVGSLPETREDALAAIDPWLAAEGIQEKRLLCLAAGGGRHAPLHALAGASVTVVDLSRAQLQIDAQIASELQLDIRVCQGSIDDLSFLPERTFDLALQPVSMCYLRDAHLVYRQIARVLKPNGLYVGQHKQPAMLQSSPQVSADGYRWETPLVEGVPLPEVDAQSLIQIREPGAAEFLHSLDTLLGGLCRVGFAIEDLLEPPRADALAMAGTAEHRAWFMPPYLKVKARRRVD